MASKDYDLFLSYDPADSAAVIKLVRRLTAEHVRVWFQEWELGPNQIRPELVHSVIVRSAAVCICNAGVAGHAEKAKTDGVACIAVDLDLGEDASFAQLSAALPMSAQPPASAESPKDNPVERARDILRGELPDLETIKELVKSLKALKKFAYARRLLARAREAYNTTMDAEERLFLGQQHALCTYKDPDQPADEKFDTAVSILYQVGDLPNTTNQETLGLAGAAYKYKFEAFGQKSDLERSLSYYLRGYEAGPQIDFGYTSINAAYVLDLLARQETDDAKDAGTTSRTAEDRKAQAQKIRAELIQILPPLQYEPKNGYLAGTWWFLATVAEAFFGLRAFRRSSVLVAERYRARPGRRLGV